MNKLMKILAAFAAAFLVSIPAMAQVDYFEDFESLPDAPDALSNAGWLVFANVFADYPGCSNYAYGYGPFPAPNGGPGFSSLVAGGDGAALNAYSDYNNGDHGGGLCIEANVFQERAFTAADAGSYQFSFDIEVPAAPDDVLGTDVKTFGFIKLLDPNNGFSLDLFLTVDTATAGNKVIDVDIDASADGKILQWGFTSTASNYATSGRWYDNVSFALAPVDPEPPIQPPVQPPGPSDAVSIPTLDGLGLLLLAALIAGIGLFAAPRR